jgi:hypothetical protein
VSGWFWSNQNLRAWWSGQTFLLDQHPVAHVVGGAILDLGLRAVFALTGLPVRHAALVRLALVAGVQALWELNQVEEYGRNAAGDPNYPYAFAALDALSALVGAGIAEAPWLLF